MQKLLLTIDRISTFVGHFFAWLIVALTFMISWEVFSRYVFNNPHPWAFDVMIMMYGTLIMMAGAYTLSTSGHVRGDVLYGFFEPRTQAIFDLLLYILTANGPPVYPFKTAIPLAGAFLLLQGAVEMIRCVICIRDGAWPSRVQDVEEVDVDKLKAMVHVKDEDIAALDKYVVAQENAHAAHPGGSSK